MNPNLPSVPVRVRFLLPAEGGRPSAVASGYRVQVEFRDESGRVVSHDCLFDFRESEVAFEKGGDFWMPLGIDGSAVLVPHDAEMMAGLIVPGARFDVREVTTLVGAGIVLQRP